jgi:hypothetical protein
MRKLARQLRNRDVVREPKLNLGYCRCDRTHVTDSQKCDLCGRKPLMRRNKKPGPVIDVADFS